MELSEHNWLEYLLEEIDDLREIYKSSFGDELWDQVLVVVKELEHLKTFALCSRLLEKKQMVSGETGPIDVCSHFEDAMRKAISDIRCALKLSFGTGKKSKLSKAVSKLRDTMEVFRPKIVEAYAHLSPIRFPEELVIFWPFVYLSELIKSAYIDLNILVDQYEEEKGHNQFQLPESVWLSAKALTRINNSLLLASRNLWNSSGHCIRNMPGYLVFLNHFAPVFVRAAYLSYSWRWMRTYDHQKGKEEIVDLLKQVMPKTPQDIDLCIRHLRAEGSLRSVIVAYPFVHFLIPDDADRNGLVMTPPFEEGLHF